MVAIKDLHIDINSYYSAIAVDIQHPAQNMSESTGFKQ